VQSLNYSYNQSVTKAYIIRIPNHEMSMQKAERAAESCELTGMDWEYWDAYDGVQNPIQPPAHHGGVPAMVKVTDHYMTRGEVACALSHISLWQKCVLDDQPLVVLEHDSVIMQPYAHHAVFNSICYLGSNEQVNQGWQVLPTPPHASEGPNYHFICRAHAYAIDPAVAKNMLAHVLKYGISAPLDILLRADIFPIHQMGVYANPEWRIDISTDEEIDQYLRAALGKDYALVQDIGVVPQTDIWRLLKLYSEGGVYLDIDRLCNIRLSDLVDSATRWVLPTCGDTDFSHDFMMTAPGNPAFANTINMYLERRRAGHANVYFLGPQTYMHGVTHTLFGQIINSNPGPEAFDEIRKHIASMGFVKTYRESPPGDTMLYQGATTAEQWESMKRKFYADNQIKHWTGEW
jgi:hypothetical protein